MSVIQIPIHDTEDNEDEDSDRYKELKENFDKRKLRLDIELKDAKISNSEYSQKYKELIDELFGGTDYYDEFYSKWQDVRDKAVKEVKSDIDRQTKEDYAALTESWGNKWDEIINTAEVSGYNAEGLSEKVDELLAEITDSAVATEDDKLAYEKKRIDFWEKQQKEAVAKLKEKAAESDDDEFDDVWLYGELKKLEASAKTSVLKADITSELASLGKEVRDTWKSETEKTIDEVTALYDDAAQAQAKAAEKYSGKIELVTKGKDKKGKDTLLFNDLDDITGKFDKYTKSLEKLRKTDIPSDLLQRIIAIDDLDQKQQMIDEILSMSDKGRALWFKDYNEAMEASNRAAAAETANLRESADIGAEKALDSIKAGFNLLPEDAYKQGLASGNAFVQGVNDKLRDAGSGYRLDLSASAGYSYASGSKYAVNAASESSSGTNSQNVSGTMSAMGIETNKTASTGGNSADAANTVGDTTGIVLNNAVIIPDGTDLVVNIAGREVIRMEIADYNKQNTLTGANVTGL